MNLTYGKDIYLSIDINLQRILYEALHKGKVTSNAKSSNGIILDPYTGEILAMAGSPSFNPNKQINDNLENLKNRSISDQYEPGSTLKVIPILDAIKIDKKNKIGEIYCEAGEYYLPNSRVKIHDHEPHEELSLDEILIFSSNIGIAKLSSMIGEDKTYISLRNFGLGVKTGIELPGEEKGVLRNIDSWSKISHSMVSMGQELSVTNLQLSMKKDRPLVLKY